SAPAASRSLWKTASLPVRSSASARAATSSGFSRSRATAISAAPAPWALSSPPAPACPARTASSLAGDGDLRGLRSLGHLVRADLRSLRPDRELRDEPLGAFSAVGELAQRGAV